MVRFLHGTNQTETSSRASSKTEIAQRDRRNGWSCPWHPLQLIAWFFLCFFAITYFGIFVLYLPQEWRPAGYIIPGGLYAIHVVVHLMALSLDPADPNIRIGHAKKNAFDRNLHAHVIENNHCHICEADVFPKSKHCSSCNKCVSDFDHHCKWLNTCVGGKNYKLFVGCISTAFAGSVLMAVINLYLFILYFTNKNSLLKTQTDGQFKLFAPVSDKAFVIFVGAVEGLHIAAIGLLGHLLGFHLYLICMNMSTYEFIVNSRERKLQPDDHEAARQSSQGTPISLKHLRNNKVRPTPEGLENGELSIDTTQPEHSSSSEESPCETTVKVMNEVSSKAAKRTSSHELPSNQNDNENTASRENPTKEHEDNVTESAVSSSAESLREVGKPQVSIETLSDVNRPSTSDQTRALRHSKSHDNMNQSHNATVDDHSTPMSNYNQSQHDASPVSAARNDAASNNFPLENTDNQSCSGRPSLSKTGPLEDRQADFANRGLSDSNGEELIPINVNAPREEPVGDETINVHNENRTSNDLVNKKKKRKSRSPVQGEEPLELNKSGDVSLNGTLTRTPKPKELPPIVTKGRRPLPTLDLTNSAC